MEEELGNIDRKRYAKEKRTNRSGRRGTERRRTRSSKGEKGGEESQEKAVRGRRERVTVRRGRRIESDGRERRISRLQ